MEYNNVICHIVGLNPNIKKKFIEKFNNKMYNTIDLDEINDEIFNNPDMEKMFKKDQSRKKHKIDKNTIHFLIACSPLTIIRE